VAKKKPAQKKKGKKALTVKQRKYAKARAAGKDKTNAARAAGYSESTARHATETIEASENYQEYLEKLLDELIDPARASGCAQRSDARREGGAGEV
jgi:hypothetical protein